jgi:hypothetical protein
MVVSACEEMIGPVRTDLDFVTIESLVEAKAKVDQLSNAGMSID